MSPTVSIVTPVFNGAAFLADHIASVQAQQMGDYEHLIVDNLSTDDGPAIVRQAAENDPRIRLMQQARDAVPGSRPQRRDRGRTRAVHRVSGLR